MNLFKEINEAATDRTNMLAEMDGVTTLSASQIDDLVDYVLDMQAKSEKNGGVTDLQELSGAALEDVPGMDNTDKATRAAIVKKIEQGAAAKQKGK